MTKEHPSIELQMIPVDLIDVLNPRERNARVFNEIVANIKAVGLKKPIRVTPRNGGGGSKRYLLICGEGRLKAFRALGETLTELLKEQQFSPNLGAVLRKMKPTRQIECVELMLAANNITVAYCQALLAATPPEMLVGEAKPKRIPGVTAEQMARMEREMGNVHGQFKLIEQSYGQDVLNLVLAKGYIAKLLDNDAVVRFLTKYQPDMLAEFEDIVRTVSLDK